MHSDDIFESARFLFPCYPGSVGMARLLICLWCLMAEFGINLRLWILYTKD
jgi:hypothetical protein